MPPMRIEFVYFDLGNILLAFDPGVSCGNVAERFGVSVEAVKAAVYASGLQDQLEHGAITSDEFAERVRAELGLSPQRLPTSELLEAVSSMFTLIDGMAGLMDDVRKSQRRMGLLSNTCHAHWDWICRQNYPLFSQPLDATVLSYEVGAMKPNEKIYQVAEQLAGVNPRQILFIDDRLENVQGAQRRGWHAEQCLGGPGAIEIVHRYLAGELPSR